MSFSELGLQETFAEHIDAAGYETPTELQQQLIPLMAQRKSALVWTQSAAGKTGAFLIPAIDSILQNPLENHQGARVLVLTSRRDRVNQITYTIKRLVGDEQQQIRTGFIVSGRPYQPQMRLLRRPLDLMIATPGRLSDLVDNNKANFSNLELLIIDDLTAIYKKGLAELINKIVEQKPKAAPVIVFVRHDDEVTPYARKIFAEAQEITIQDEKSLLLQLTQTVHNADDYTHKLALTDYLLDHYKGKSTVIFTSSSKTAKTLADNLANHGHTADATHLLPEEERNLEACPILIVPDQENFVPEMSGKEMVIHFELPEKVETYQNRLRDVLGCEETGPVLLLVTNQDRENLKRIEAYQGEAINARHIPGLEPKATPRSTVSTKPAHGRANPRKEGGGGKARTPRTTQGQGERKARPNGSGAKPHQAQGRKPSSSHANNGPVQANGNGDDKQRQARKGPYGRLNGGAQRKPNTMRSDAPYEIGSWEKQDYVPKQPNAADKKVVIRYKEKRRQPSTPSV